MTPLQRLVGAVVGFLFQSLETRKVKMDHEDAKALVKAIDGLGDKLYLSSGGGHILSAITDHGNKVIKSGELIAGALNNLAEAIRECEFY
jgi:hypothetical protein